MCDPAFDPQTFYQSYPEEVIGRPGYPARAAYKSALLFSRFGARLLEQGPIRTYADVGGCFGFGANAMSFHIGKQQGFRPETRVFELTAGFTDIGKRLFPKIDFVTEDFNTWQEFSSPFDLITLFDVVEHIPQPQAFLEKIAARSQYQLLKTPMEARGRWRKAKPPTKSGATHPDGHVNFFNPDTYLNLLERSGLEVLAGKWMPAIFTNAMAMAITPENPHPKGPSFWGNPKYHVSDRLRKCRFIPSFIRQHALGWGEYICLCRSRSV